MLCRSERLSCRSPRDVVHLALDDITENLQLNKLGSSARCMGIQLLHHWHKICVIDFEHIVDAGLETGTRQFAELGKILSEAGISHRNDHHNRIELFDPLFLVEIRGQKILEVERDGFALLVDEKVQKAVVLATGKSVDAQSPKKSHVFSVRKRALS